MTKQHHTGMVLIAGFKVVKGLLLLLVGLGFLKLVHAETATLFAKLLEALHLNAESHVLHALVLQVDALRPESILTLGAMSLLYAGLLLTEGLGLWFERSWAAYLTVISTSLFIPLEIYEIIKRVTAMRIGLLLVNLAIVVYLIRQLKYHTLRKNNLKLLGPRDNNPIPF
jgi:uncharacterized membrane protein (DUF2068 family)